MRLTSRRRFIELVLAEAGLVAVSGCGTIMYPERVGQPSRGPLDWKVVALDTLGLLFFLIPGIIAFAVDFHNGTIYLPPGGPGVAGMSGAGEKLVMVQVKDEPLTMEKVERIVSQHTQQEVRLTPGGYETEELASIDDFWSTTSKYHQVNPS